MTSKGYRLASTRDVPAIVALVNSVYRGDSSRLGWTTEADLLDGQRTDAAEVAELLAAPDSDFLLAEDDSGLLGCAHLKRDGERAWFGMFSIRPGRQGQGLGQAFLTEAEARARQLWSVGAMRMSVISLRRELIAYYERRGYRRTGETLPFPTDPRFGVPKVEGLQFMVLEKRF
ncbi:MAG: GNAT family N-acetyltransferase [Gammaproteobacteria bacterium]|nr:GNAT family N-acetyltransferase [Gammaproteobacteria bacterium]